MKHSIGRPRKQRGQAIVEFALITPIVLLFLFTIVDFGIALDRRLVLQHSVREGSRFAAVNTSSAAIKQRVVDQAQGLIDTTDVTICYIDGDDANSLPGNVGDSVRVSVDFTYDLAIVGPVLRLASNNFGGSGNDPGAIDMTPSGTARLETGVLSATAC